MKSRPNVILITIDALRADHLSSYGYHRETSPFLETLSTDSIWFKNTWSVSSHTREAMPPILSGQRPETFAANGFRQVEKPLASRLSELGYQTGGFHSNPYLSRAYGFDTGFDEFYDDLLMGQNRILALAQRAIEKFVTKRGEYYARAPEINRRSLNWLDTLNSDAPFFLWNHYMDVHGPYHSPETVYADQSLSASESESLYRKSWKQPEEITTDEQHLLRDSYDDEIRYLDAQLDSFFKSLQERNLVENSLIIVTADHGDAFGEHGYYTHPRYLHESLLSVPLYVLPPSGNSGSVECPVSTLDVVPTILESVNGDTQQLPGTPLLSNEGKPQTDTVDLPIASATGENEDEGTRRFAIRDKNQKVMMTRDIKSGTILNKQFVDLERDPTESEIREPDSNSVDYLIDQLQIYSNDKLIDTEQENADAEPTDEINDRLEALGYK